MNENSDQLAACSKKDMDAHFLEQVVRVAAAYEATEFLYFVIVTDEGYWAGPGKLEGPLKIMVNCNDLFWWGTADAEPIETYEDLKLFEECLKLDESYGSTIYACRKRKMRPQNCVMERIPEDVRPHLETCGPPRTNAECG